VLASDGGDPTIIYCAPEASTAAERSLSDAGAIVCRTQDRDGYVDLRAVLTDLAERGVNELFVEGGGGLIGALLDARLVDDVVTFIGPMFVGGSGPSPVAGRGVATMPEALRLVERRMRLAGEDIMIHGRVEYPEAVDV
jgi:diaminohydroxyphosphoribosylaminopyrimidine deaminase/5-amino-6-(5-phosphoribosylamino)uracil reductase